MLRRSVSTRLLASLPIRWRLALVSFSLLALLLAGLGILISTSEENVLITSQADALQHEIDLAQLQLAVTKPLPGGSQISTFPGMTKDSASNVVSLIEGLSPQTGIAVLTSEGAVLATNMLRVPGSAVAALPRVTLTRSILQRGPSEGSYLLLNDERGQRELVVLRQIITLDKAAMATKETQAYSKALLQLSLPTTPIDQSVASTRLILALGICVALAIAGALTLPLIGVALRPLIEMETVSSLIAGGALSLRLAEPSSRDEIGRMARAFNSMVAGLETNFARQKRFVADVSHELRTPLTGLGGSLEMLLIGADNDDEEIRHQLLSGMYSEVERMQRLVESLLALARLDEGHLKLQLERVAVAPLLEQVCEQVQGLVAGQQLSLQVPAELPALRADPEHLRRVLLNLVENALKFTPPGGCICLEAAREGAEYIRLEIRDTGIGISAQDLPYVFDRFYRADTSRTRLLPQAGGSGLGLSIARELVEAQGGKIALQSTPGAGTLVTLWLQAAC